jgi:hypothetical protein
MVMTLVMNGVTLLVNKNDARTLRLLKIGMKTNTKHDALPWLGESLYIPTDAMGRGHERAIVMIVVVDLIAIPFQHFRVSPYRWLKTYYKSSP